MTPRQLLLELQSRLFAEYEDVETEMQRSSDLPSVWTPLLVMRALIPTTPYTDFVFTVSIPESQYIFDRLVVDTLEGSGTAKQLETLNDGSLERLATAFAPDLIKLYMTEIGKQHERSAKKGAELMKGGAVMKTTDTLTIKFGDSVHTATVG